MANILRVSALSNHSELQKPVESFLLESQTQSFEYRLKAIFRDLLERQNQRTDRKMVPVKPKLIQPGTDSAKKSA